LSAGNVGFKGTGVMLIAVAVAAAAAAADVNLSKAWHTILQ